MKRSILFLVFSFVISSVEAVPPGPYNQTYNYNQQFGSTNWYSSPLGQGVAQGGIILISGLVNAMSRPEPQVVYVNQNQQPQVVQGNYQQQPYDQQVPYGYQAGPPNPYNQQPVYGAQ